MKNMYSITQKRMPQHPGLCPLRTFLFEDAVSLSMMASRTRHPFPVPVLFPLKAQPGPLRVPSGTDVHSLSRCHSCGCFPRTPPSESHVFKGLVHDTPEHGFILQHTSVCRQKGVPPTEPGPWLQPGLHGVQALQEAKPGSHHRRLHFTCLAGGCAGEMGWGSRADSDGLPSAGDHLLHPRAAGWPVLGRLQGQRGQADAVPSAAVTLPPGEGALWALGWEDAPWGPTERAGSAWPGHLRGSDHRHVKGGAPTPEIPPNMVRECSFVLTFYFVNVVVAINVKPEKTWESLN